MANGINNRVFDEMKFRTGALDPPLFNPEETYYQPVGSNELYKKGDRRLGRHEIVDEVTMKGGKEISINKAVPSPVSRGLVPLMPTSPLDLAIETVFSSIGEAGGAGAEIGTILGLVAGIKGGKYAIRLGDELIKGSKKSVKFTDDVLGHEVSKYKLKKAFDKIEKDPMFAHIDFKKSSKFERPGTKYTDTGGESYAAKYTAKEGFFLFDELFPSSSKGWYSKPNPKTGYVGSMKAEWQGGEKYMGKASGQEKPFTFRTNPLSSQYPIDWAESVARHEGRHFMQNYPMTSSVEYNVWDEMIAGRSAFNVSSKYGGSYGSNEFKTLIDIEVPKSVKKLDFVDVRKLSPDSDMGIGTGFHRAIYDNITGKKLDMPDNRWTSYKGPIEVEARLEQLYSFGGQPWKFEHSAFKGRKKTPMGSVQWSSLRKLGYDDDEIVSMLKNYIKARKKAYGPKPDGGWTINKVNIEGKNKPILHWVRDWR